jgi:hypothetical protein
MHINLLLESTLYKAPLGLPLVLMSFSLHLGLFVSKIKVGCGIDFVINLHLILLISVQRFDVTGSWRNFVN